MIAAATFAPDQIVRLLTVLNHGEAVSFSQEPQGPLAFTIAKTDRSFVVRDARGRALASASTFAEAWRSRPRPDVGVAPGRNPQASAQEAHAR